MEYTSIILALSLLLTACGQRSDAAIRQHLPGSWHFVQPPSNSDRSLFTIAPNGDFTNVVLRPDGTLQVETSGTFQVQDGYVIVTVTRSSQHQSPTPMDLRAKILKADSQQMVIQPPGTTRKMTIVKDTK